MDKKYYWARVEHYRQKARESYYRNKEYHQKYWKEHPEKRRNADLKNRYGITSEEYIKLYEKQQGKCLICGRPQEELKSKLAVDHCHKTKIIRGLLCRTCNAHLGWHEKWIDKIENYLKNN